MRNSGSVRTPYGKSRSWTLSALMLSALLSMALPTWAADFVVAWGAGSNPSKIDNSNRLQSVVPASLTNAAYIAGGGRHSFAVNADGTLTGWGDDTAGQLDFLRSVTNDYAAVACGYLHTLALRTNGTVAAVGYDLYGQTEVPLGLSNVVAISAGFYHSLALRADGTVVAWGMSTNDADIGRDPNYGQTRIPAGLSNVVAIAVGGWHNLVLKSDGTVRCWGLDSDGQGEVPAGVSNVVAVSAGAAHNLVLKADGSLFAWGSNLYGQTNIPAGLSNVVVIAAGGWHNLALRSDGTVVAWGAGSGSNPDVDFGQNVVPSGLSNVVEIAAGARHSLALVSDVVPLPSRVRLTDPIVDTEGFSVGVPTRHGGVYRLQYTESLAAPVWESLPLTAGTGGLKRLNDPEPSAGKRFYRVQQW